MFIEVASKLRQNQNIGAFDHLVVAGIIDSDSFWM